MEGINPLSTPQQRFLQRLLASHVMVDGDLQDLWHEIQDSEAATTREYLGRDLNDTLSIINRSLKPAFGLEIRSVSLALSSVEDDSEDDNDDNNNEDDASVPKLYHGIINCQGDAVSRTTSFPEMTKNPHELALFRLIIERLIEQSQSNHDESDQDEGEHNNSRKRRRRDRRGIGCQASLSRMAMINLRTELTGAHAGKLTIQQVENALQLFTSQGWLVTAANLNINSPQKRKSKSKRKGSMGTAGYLQLGPRSYMEFADFMKKAGLDVELLPQFLVHA